MRKIFVLLIILALFALASCANKQFNPMISVKDGKLYEVFVKQVMIDQSSGVTRIPVIILANKENDRQFLPIWVGFSEGISINNALKKEKIIRPGTHDLFASVLREFQMKIIRIVVTEVLDDTYIASIAVESHGETKEIDSRSSDAIAIALRTDAPIYISEKALGKAGWAEIPQQGDSKKEEEEEKRESIKPEDNSSI